MRYDCIIIGGGIVGLMTARELMLTGKKTLLIDKGSVGRESSWAGGGILSPLSPWDMPDVVTQLGAWSQKNYAGIVDQLIETADINPEMIASGLVVLETKDKNKCLQWGLANDMQINQLDNTNLKNIIPNLNDRFQSALHLPRINQIRNPLLIKALKKFLLINGVNIIEHECGVTLSVVDNVCVGIHSPSIEHKAEVTIVTCGAWSNHVVNELPVKLDIKPIRGQMILFKCNKKLFSQIILKNELYLIPRRDNLILSGSTLEDAGFSKDLTDEGFKLLRASALDLIPELENYKIIDHWAGLRPKPNNEVPLIGRVPNIDGLYVNTGHYRNGIHLAPASARLVSDLILNRPPIVNPDPFCI